jgi:hypothetical protein
MKHAGAETIKGLAGLLTELRQRAPLREKTPGTFYVKSKAFLHFHEDPAGIFADVKLDLQDYSRYRINTAAEQAALLKKIDKCLAEQHGGRRE